MRTRKLVTLVAMMAGCATAGSRGPSFTPSTPIKPFYTASVLNCLASTAAAAGGKPVSTSGNYGTAALRSMEQRASNLGVGGPLTGDNLCSAVEGLLGGDGWAANAELKRSLRQYADGQVQAGGPPPAAILIPIASSSDPACTKDGLYSHSSDLVVDYGSVTCWERSVRVGLLLFAPDGTLLWRIHREQSYAAPGAPNMQPGMVSEVNAVFDAMIALFRS